MKLVSLTLWGFQVHRISNSSKKRLSPNLKNKVHKQKGKREEKKKEGTKNRKRKAHHLSGWGTAGPLSAGVCRIHLLVYG